MKSLKITLTAYLLGLVSLGFLSTNVGADNYFWSPETSSSPVRIDVIDDSGRALNQYTANRNGYNTSRSYLEAIKGKRYKLRIRNNSNKRVAVVIAVDGRNILSGRKSYLRSNEKMYVLNPYETSTYSGWRTSKNRVNRFYFTSAGGSYANAWGDRSAMGVIAVAVYDEKQKYYYKKPQNDFRSGKMAPSQGGRLSSESVGTGFGHEEYSPTRKVSFKAKSKPTRKYFFKYEWRNTLCKRGIARCNQYQYDRDNNRFWPKEADNRNNEGYAPYPPDFYLRDGRIDRDLSSTNFNW